MTGDDRDGQPARAASSSDRDREDRLSRAAAALAAAEGMVAAAGPGPRRAGGRDAGSVAPPPDDPAAQSPEADPESVARAIVLRQLSMAPRSRAQLERKLRQRGCDDDVAARVLDRMTQVGLVDDEAYAEMLVRARHAGKGLARRALAHELRKQGIDQDVAEEALGQVGAGDERMRAEQLVQKRMRSLHGLPAEVQTRRLAGLLARKGYSSEVAWPVIREAVGAAPEHQRD
ncbi:regulatory protein RecX [Humibacillus xanthopallidus]|uniref:Regulatory protein RecX n=1 Tax=Humibacillus xanthopallidus TaxID=412689 RepID=A0A543HWU2_9MICO|nr:regulatory protein RecX [Humibacillus xanthopallidus]TQM62750.1 regulatory protein [Humibacillus xanthopallidus]